jgi:two-component system OmpR family response regulator
VLVADDHAAVRSVVADALRAHGYTVDEASDGDSALEQLRRGGYCAAVVDQKMPGSSGLAVAEAIRDERLGCRAIVISVVADPETRRRADELGARFHQKPFQLDDLLDDVRTACEGDQALP